MTYKQETHPTVLGISTVTAAATLLFGGLVFAIGYWGDNDTSEGLQLAAAMAFSIPIVILAVFEFEPGGAFLATAVGLTGWAFAFCVGMIFSIPNIYVGFAAAAVSAFVCSFHFRKYQPPDPHAWIAALPFLIGPILYTFLARR